MVNLKNSYWIELSGIHFEIRALNPDGHFLVIDGQFGNYFYTAEQAALDCKHGHVTTIVVAKTAGEKPYRVSTKSLEFPPELSGWNRNNVEPLEFIE